MEQDLTKDVVKKQNRKITVFACLLSVVSIGLLVFGFMAVSSNKVIMLQSISNLNNKLDPFLENNKVLLDKLANSKDVGLRTNIDVNVNELVAQDASFNINFDYLENRDDQKSKLNLEVTANNEELVKGQVALANQKVYGFINDITPKYYYTALEYTSLLSSLSSKDTEKILSLLKDSVNDSINNDDIKKEKVTINYNGKDKKVNKLSYTITSKKVKAVLDKFFNSLKKEKTLFSNISKQLNLTETELETEINNLLSYFDKDEEEIVYSVYYYGFNKIVQYELGTVDNKDMIQYKIEDKESIKLFSEGTCFVSLEVTKNKKQYDFTGYIGYQESKLDFSGTVLDNKTTIKFTVDDTNIRLEITENDNNNDLTYNDTIDLYVSAGGLDLKVVTINTKIEYYFDQKVDVSLDNSTDFNEMTEEDYNTIYNNFQNHPLYEVYEEILNSISSDFDISL